MAGYTRQDTANNIANGNVIDADDFDAEYNSIEASFNASTGHKHDGTTGEGAPITKVGPSQDLIVSGTVVIPKTTNTLDLGSSSVQFKDAWLDGTLDTDALVVSANATVGGTLGVTGVLTATGGVVGNVTGALTGNVTGTTSDVSNHDTDDIAEGGTNQYFTTARARNSVSAAGSLSYAPSTGVFSYTQGDTDTVTEGATNLYYTTIRATADAKAAISVTDSGGDGSLAYSAGVITYTGPSATDVRAHFSGGTGVSITDGVVAVGQAVGTTSNVTFNSVTADVTGDLIGNITGNVTGNIAGNVTGNVTGNADTATSLESSRNIQLTGDVTGSASFNGTANALITATVEDDSHNHVISNVDGLQTGLDRRLELISETVLTSNASDVIFTLPTGYRDFQLVLSNVKSTGNTAVLYIEASTDGGSTFDATANYSSLNVRHLETAGGSESTSMNRSTTGINVATNNVSDQTVVIGGTTYNFPTVGASGVVNILNPLNANEFTAFSGAIVNAVAGTGTGSSSGETMVQTFGGVYGLQTAVNAINLSHKTGSSVAAGAVVALYGMKDY